MLKTVVIDTNCLLQIFPRKSSKRWLYNYIRNGNILLAVSTEILEEYEEIITQQTNSIIAENIVQALLNSPFILHIEPAYRWQLIKEDPDDDKFVDCAIAANANFLITNDGHFKVLDSIDFPKLTRLKLSQVTKALFK